MSKIQPPRESRNPGTMVLVFVLIAIAVGFVLFLSLIIPGALGFVAVCGGFVLFGGLHFLLWGWWMPRSRPPDEPTEESAVRRD